MERLTVVLLSLLLLQKFIHVVTSGTATLARESLDTPDHVGATNEHQEAAHNLQRRYVPQFVGKRKAAQAQNAENIADGILFNSQEERFHDDDLGDQSQESLLNDYKNLDYLPTDTKDEEYYNELGNDSQGNEFDVTHSALDTLGLDDEESLLEEIERSNIPYSAGKRGMLPLFVGKRYNPMFVGKKYAPMFVGKKDDPGVPEEKRYKPMFIGKRATPMFVGKRATPMFVGKRYNPMFVGKKDESRSLEEKRYTPMFIGKKASRTPMFVGKRHNPMFVGKRYNPMFVGKRYNPMFVGKRYNPMFVGKKYNPMFVGKRYNPMFVGKRYTPMFVGKRRVPLFIGKRDTSDISESSERNIEIKASQEQTDNPHLRRKRSTVIMEQPDEMLKRAWGRYIPWSTIAGVDASRIMTPVAKRFVGQGTTERKDSLSSLLTALKALDYARNGPGLTSKRFEAPLFIGKRSDGDRYYMEEHKLVPLTYEALLKLPPAFRVVENL